MIPLTDLADTLPGVERVGRHELRLPCVRCGGKATIRDFGARRSFRCESCGKLEEADFSRTGGVAQPPPSRLAHASAYARHGMRVFPVHEIEPEGCSCGKLECPSAGKHPRVKDWQTLATCDE